MCHPIKRSAINNGTANSHSMTVHILCGGVNDNIGSPLNRTTIHWRRKRIINNQGDTMRMCSLCPTLNIKHHKRRIGNGLTKDALSRGSECRSNFFIGGIGRDKRALHTHLRKRCREQVKRTSINSGNSHDMASCLSDIKDREERCCHTGCRKHCGASAFKLADFCRNTIKRWILQARIEIT